MIKTIISLSGDILRRVFLTCAFIASAVATYAAFPYQIKGIDPEKVAVLIYDLQADSVVMDHNGSLWLVPASVMKSVTSAAVLSTQDGERRFTTPVFAQGEIAGSTLRGNLVIECCGDPTIESRHFPDNLGFADSIAAAVARSGISNIAGDIMIGTGGFANPGTPASWLKEDILWPYGTGLYGANYKDNTIKMSLPSGTMEPAVPGTTISKQGGKGGLKVSRDLDSRQFVVTGTIPRRGHSDTYANPNPAASMKHEVVAALQRRGISVSAGKLTPEPTTTLIYTHTSPTVREILRSLMVRSDNMMAEGMLRSLAPAGGTRADAIERESFLWEDFGIDTDRLVIEDGSGLSRANRLSALFLTGLYRQMLQTGVAADYVALFPRAGMDGTMKNFLRGTALEGRVAMKTGSMRGIQCFGGYMLDKDGCPTHTIVVLVNGFTADRAAVKNHIANMLLDRLATN
ncbi:MAG: D-alanyl-D-alanine carboxypeptidase/D-alanyl-D-alanine-endopeptidase [Muribaculaceae bacterium]|nr:D-alanyl-D-alanine carboxypeptidase/D-alanyl-D-alanine-endopeptidase [Muribaculaceae bacterium]